MASRDREVAVVRPYLGRGLVVTSLLACATGCAPRKVEASPGVTEVFVPAAVPPAPSATAVAPRRAGASASQVVTAPRALPEGYECDPKTNEPCEGDSVCAEFTPEPGRNIAYCTSDQ